MSGTHTHDGHGHDDHHGHAHAAPAAEGGAELQLTEGALERFRAVMASEKLDAGHAVRIGVASGGCSGMSYTMGFDNVERPGDAVIERGGLRFLIDAESRPYLEGVTIDYVVGLHKQGFKFDNPKAARTCGCGESFGA